MASHSRIALSAAAFLCITSLAAKAQNSPPTYEADPGIFKVIYEDQYFRVIDAHWRAGEADKPHSHPLPSIAYPVTDCTLKLTNPDGTSKDRAFKAGAPAVGIITPSHVTTNAGSADCHLILVERK
jgi:hypothetical protein